MSRVGFQQINGHFKMLSCKFCDIYHFSFSIVGTLNWMLVHKVQNKRKRKKQLLERRKNDLVLNSDLPLTSGWHQSVTNA